MTRSVHTSTKSLPFHSESSIELCSVIITTHTTTIYPLSVSQPSDKLCYMVLFLLPQPTTPHSLISFCPLLSVVTGRKRWVLLPPEVKKSIAKGLDVIRKGRYRNKHTHIRPLIYPLKPSHHPHSLLLFSFSCPSPILLHLF